MSIYQRDDVLPEWEPIPWGANGRAADEQELGFHERALKPITWAPIPFRDFPVEGFLGQSRDWFIKRGVSHYAKHDGEDLLLVDNDWHGFPDPPRWGLATRAVSGEWRAWGHFPDLPASWTLQIRDLDTADSAKANAQ